jgi:hypothetical protein
MKKILTVLLVVFSVSLISCPGPYDNNQLTFEEAVYEVYQIVGEIFYYPSQSNRVTGPNERSGLCGSYTDEFLLYWNEILNYDEVYGRAYSASSSQKASNANFSIADVKFVPKGTGFKPYNDQYDRGVGEMIGNQIPLLLHYGEYPYSHGWPVIFYNGDWYGCDPTWWDTSLWREFPPYKFTF